MHHLTTRLLATIALTTFAAGCGSAAVTATSTGTSPMTTPVATSSPESPGSTFGTSSPTSVPVASTDPSTDPSTGTPDSAPAAILDRFWRTDANITVGGLHTLPTGSVAGFTITADGTMTVNTGCNTGTAKVTFENGTQMVVGPLTLTKNTCQGSAGDIETTMLFILAERNNYFVKGDTLTLTPLTITDVGLTLKAGSSG